MRCTWLVAIAGGLAVGFGAARPAGAQCLEFQADVIDGAGGAALEGAYAVEVAPDGESLYAAAIGEAALSVFARDPATGAVTFSAALRDGVAGVDGLEAPAGIGVSPDGKHVYVVGSGGLGVFAEAPGSVQLDFVESRAALEITYGSDAVVSPDGRHVYVADPGGNRIVMYGRNATTGALTHLGGFADGQSGAPLSSVTDVAVSPDGEQVYAVASGDNSLVHFARDAASGLLTLTESHIDGSGAVDGLQSAKSLAVSPDGRHLYAGGTREMAVFARSGDAVTFQEAVKDGVGGVALQEARDVAVSSDGLRVFAVSTDLNDARPDGVTVFARDPATGSLRQVETRGDGAAPEDRLFGTQGLAVSPDGTSVYAAAFNDGALTAWRWPDALREVQVVRDGEGGAEGLDGAGFALPSADGRFLYVAGFDEDAIAVFARDARLGTLSFVELERNGLGGVVGFDGPGGLALSPDGRHLYATALITGAVAVFSRNTTTGALSFVQSRRDGLGGVDGIAGASSVLVSPDGRDVYVGGYNDAAVAHFARDGATGGLTFVSAIFDGQAGADGLEGAGGLAMAMDGQGRHLYVPSSNESTLTVFERDPVTGALTWVQTLRDGGGVVSTLGFAFSALLSPDDALLYLTAATDGALTSFVRDPEFGVLDVLEAEIDGVGGVTGLAGARGLARSADGRRVYVAAQTSDAVAAFDFDPEFGATTQSGAVASGACAATLDFPAHVAVAGRFVYAPYLMSDAVLVLAPEPLAAWSALAAFAALAARSRSRVRARPKACR